MIIYGNCQSYQSFISSRNFLKRLRRSGRSHGKQALDVLSFIRRKRQINRQLCPFLLACVQPPSPPLRKKSTFPERRGWLYTMLFAIRPPTSHFRLPKTLLGFSSTQEYQENPSTKVDPAIMYKERRQLLRTKLTSRST